MCNFVVRLIQGKERKIYKFFNILNQHHPSSHLWTSSRGRNSKIASRSMVKQEERRRRVLIRILEKGTRYRKGWPPPTV